jgi:hypothetical protein
MTLHANGKLEDLRMVQAGMIDLFIAVRELEINVDDDVQAFVFEQGFESAYNDFGGETQLMVHWSDE